MGVIFCRQRSRSQILSIFLAPLVVIFWSGRLTSEVLKAMTCTVAVCTMASIPESRVYATRDWGFFDFWEPDMSTIVGAIYNCSMRRLIGFSDLLGNYYLYICAKAAIPTYCDVINTRVDIYIYIPWYLTSTSELGSSKPAKRSRRRRKAVPRYRELQGKLSICSSLFFRCPGNSRGCQEFPKNVWIWY